MKVIIISSDVVQAKEMLIGFASSFNFEQLPIATFTTDDWLSNPDFGSMKINTDRSVSSMIADISADSTQIHIAKENEATVRANGFKGLIFTSGPQFIKNKMTVRVSGTFGIGKSFNMIKNTHKIYSETITSDEDSYDVFSIPRFTWLRPAITDHVKIYGVGIQIFYSLKLWRIFDDDGSVLSKEEAINRVHIWQVDNHIAEAIDFDPGASREDLISGRKYCWQVQAFDEEGQYISQTNEDKSDAWVFTIQFSPPSLNDPQTFFPLAISWAPAQAGGSQVYYRIRLGEDPDFSSAYEEYGLMMTSYNYPADAPALQRGTVYYFELQATDDSDIPLGEPEMILFELPPVVVSLMSLDDGSDSPLMTPTFTWMGNSKYYVVSIYDEASDRTFTWSVVADTRWMYEGEELQQGATYVWTVTPTNENSDPIGDASEAWSFTLPSQNEASLISPVNEAIFTILPLFTWNEIPPSLNRRVVYDNSIMDGDDTVIHSATVSEAQYQYPQVAAQLGYASRYTWLIVARIEGAAVSWESAPAWLSTPFVVEENENVSMNEMNEALQVAMSEFSEFEESVEMVFLNSSIEFGKIPQEEIIEVINFNNIIPVEVQ
ncbi:hypothetical protein ACFL6P_00185 [Candidatus Latescibacterota bacterium]